MDQGSFKESRGCPTNDEVGEKQCFGHGYSWYGFPTFTNPFSRIPLRHSFYRTPQADISFGYIDIRIRSIDGNTHLFIHINRNVVFQDGEGNVFDIDIIFVPPRNPAVLRPKVEWFRDYIREPLSLESILGLMQIPMELIGSSTTPIARPGSCNTAGGKTIAARI